MINKMLRKLFKWIFITFFSIFLIGLICIIYFSYNPSRFYEMREYFNQNSITIKTDSNLDLNKINIHWISETNDGLLIKNGQPTNLIFKEYGPNRFTILYERDTIKKFMYFKGNNWHGHEHKFFLSKKKSSNKINVNVEIFGLDVN